MCCGANDECSEKRCDDDWCNCSCHCCTRYFILVLLVPVFVLLVYGTVTWNDKTLTICTIRDFNYDYGGCIFHFVTTVSANCSVPTYMLIGRYQGGDVLCNMFGKYVAPIVGKDKRFSIPCMVKSSIDWKSCPAKLTENDHPVFNYQAKITEAQFCVLFGFIVMVFLLLCTVVVFTHKYQGADIEPLLIQA